MYRTKNEVELHVRDVLSKINNENEKNLRGYSFARLFFNVKDYRSAKKHLLAYLSARENHAPANKLLAQIHEANNDLGDALQSFKRSLEIDAHQNDIILKICDLYSKLAIDNDTAKYWADRAEKIFPHHEIVFRLRERLASADGDSNNPELENLIATELASQPKNVDLRIRLLRFYLDKDRAKEAYEHAVLIESKQLFRNKVEWYHLLRDVYEAYQEERCNDLDSQFYINFISAMDHLLMLTLAEPQSLAYENGKKQYSINDAADVLLIFDKLMKKAVERKTKEGSWNYFVHHMKGQLYFHMATLLLKRAKSDQGNYKEAVRFSSALAAICYTFKPADLLQEIWFSQMEENQKAFTGFFQQGTLRMSFIGHVITELCKEEKSKWLQNLKLNTCITQVKERIYKRLFSSANQKDKADSFFVQDTYYENASLENPSDETLEKYDKGSYKLCAGSLHHLVWLELHHQNSNSDKFENNLLEAMKGLQYSNKNLTQGSCESLCVLDFESFLRAALYQTRATLEKRKELLSSNAQDSQLCYPPSIVDPMCSMKQSSWWKAAHGLHSCTIKEKLGEFRRELQHGLEVIRGIGTHGMEVQLIIHLARYFVEQENSLNKEENRKMSNTIEAIRFRAIHYWRIALDQLNKQAAGGTQRIPKEPMFASISKPLSSTEIKDLVEEGELYLAVCLMNSEKLDKAAEKLCKLSSPYASYYLALTLKSLASKEETYSATRIALLSKARSALLETMDRIKEDASHSLNKDIHVVLEEVENELATEKTNYTNNSYEESEEVDSYSSPVLNGSIYATPNGQLFNNSYSTPKPSAKFLPSSTKISLPNAPTPPKHFQPSPERLDAQIRALALNQDVLVKSIMSQQQTWMSQQQTLMESNKMFVETVKQNTDMLEQLKKQMEELKIACASSQPKTPASKPALPKSNHIEAEYDFDPASFVDPEGSSDFQRTAPPPWGAAWGPSPVPHDAEAARALNYMMPHASHALYQYPPAVLTDRAPFYPPGQSLPFAERSQLQPFHFHLPPPMVKAPSPQVMSSNDIAMPPQSLGGIRIISPQSLTSLTLSSQSIGNMANLPSQSTATTSNLPMPIMTSISIAGQNVSQGLSSTLQKSVPHQFQIPLPVSQISLVPPSHMATVLVSSELRSMMASQAPAITTFSLSSNPAVANSATTTPSTLFSGFIKSPEVLKSERPRYDSETANSDVDGHDIEKEVMGDFKPLIPLPDEIVVETGEENEIVLFEDRAKLYRYVGQEWKERGTGTVKILHHNASGKVRLLMRRDQVFKVCANHIITSNMEINPLKSSDRAWTWLAQDFAEEELKPEHFCIRFKTNDIAIAFKLAFEKAVSLSKDVTSANTTPQKAAQTPPAVSQPFGAKFLPKVGSWDCPSCYVNNAADKLSCLACEAKKPGSTPALSVAKTPETTAFNTIAPFGTNSVCMKDSTDQKTIFGGFTFSSTPVVAEEVLPKSSEQKILVVSTKSKDGPQVTKVTQAKSSPFNNFSFSTPITTTSATESKFSFGMPSTAVSTASRVLDFSVKTASPPQPSAPNSNMSLGALQNMLDNVGELSFNLNVKQASAKCEESVKNVPSGFLSADKIGMNLENVPLIPVDFRKLLIGADTEDYSPSAVDPNAVEEDETKLFGERVKLFRCDSASSEWKEHGIGELKILYLEEKHLYRILMVGEKTGKVCANHPIFPEMRLVSLPTQKNFFSWLAKDFSEGGVKTEKFAAKFANDSNAQSFSKIFARSQAEIKARVEGAPNPCKGNVAAFEVMAKGGQKDTVSDGRPLSELFKPEAGSWECPGCYTRNKATDNKCKCCDTPNPLALKDDSSSNQGEINFGTPNAEGFLFGKSKPSSDFVFGQKPIVQSANFSFGQNDQKSSESDDVPAPPANTPSGFTFGGKSLSKFDFSSLSKPADQSEASGAEFRFGSPQKYDFSFGGVRPRSPTKTPKSPRSPATPSDVDEDEDGADIYFTPAIPLPPKVDVKTGEEDEAVLFCQRAKLFRFLKSEWKERGVGDVKILQDVKTEKCRLLMRREQVLKVCLSHMLTKDINFAWRGDNSLTWTATDFSESEPTPQLFAIRFKTSELAEQFKLAINNAVTGKAVLKTPNSSATSTPDTTKSASLIKAPTFTSKTDTPPKMESNFTAGSLSAQFGIATSDKSVFGGAPVVSGSSASLFSFKDKLAAGSFFSTPTPVDGSKSVFGGDSDCTFGKTTKSEPQEQHAKDDDDVQFLCEVTATPEQIAAAEKLMLPRGFYLYEKKVPCKGCYGCTETIPKCKGDLSGDSAPATATQETEEDASKEKMFSFSDLANSSKSASFTKSPQNKSVGFSGAGAPVFGNRGAPSVNEDGVVESQDIHFEPLIPLPALIDVKTGEEDEKILFVFRSKLFRFDPNTKQWKERGIGEIKILQHKELNRFRILFRRDQVLNVACNHFIAEDMTLSPLNTSNNAVCWNAVDYSDSQAEPSKFAVRFKHKEQLDEFQEVFTRCLELLKSGQTNNSLADLSQDSPASAHAAEASTPEVLKGSEDEVHAPESAETSYGGAEAYDEENYSDDKDDDDDLMYSKNITLEIYDDQSKKFKKAGVGCMTIMYDDECFGYRIRVMVDRDTRCICDNIIAVQNCVRIEGKKATWSAIDYSIDPPRKQQFRALFSSNGAVNEFQRVFEEGKEFALGSSIVENEE